MNDYLLELLEILRERFNASELQDLCFTLNIDYDSLEGTNKNDKARELILFLDRRNNLYDLVKYGRRYRQDIEWKYLVERDGFIRCSPWWDTPGSEIAVRFTPKTYPCKLNKIKFFIPKAGQPTTKFEARIYSSENDKNPGSKINQKILYGKGSEHGGWVEIEISNENITIEKGDFYVSMVWLTAPLREEHGLNAQFLGSKTGNYPLRTYFKQGADGGWHLPEHRHCFIEVITNNNELLQNP